jgi:hypothetical protein
MQVPMVDTYGLRELAVLWCWGTEGVEAHSFEGSNPRIYTHIQDALDPLLSALTAVRFRDIIEVHPDAVYDALSLLNFTKTLKFTYNKYASVDTHLGASTLDSWLQSAPESGLANACGYDLILRLYKTPIEALQRPDPFRKDHKGGRFKDMRMTVLHWDLPHDSLGFFFVAVCSFFEAMCGRGKVAVCVL